MLFWDFADLIHPQIILETPQEVACFSFHPENANFVAAGAANGQVVLWDVGHAMSALDKRRARKRAALAGAAVDDDADAEFDEQKASEPVVLAEPRGNRTCLEDARPLRAARS